VLRILLLLAGCCCALTVRGAEFETASQLYDQGKFSEAKAGYEKLVDAGQWTANLFYNLGNTEHRLGAPGEAMLAYERALALDPAHPEARANLDFLRSQTGAVPWPKTWVDGLFPAKWADAIAIAGALAGWTVVFLFMRILTTPWRDNTGLWTGVVGCLLISIYATADLWCAAQDRSLAIVTAKTAEVHLAPAESAAPGATLPAGSEVRVLSERGDWVYCALPGPSRGWLPAKALERVRLGAS
jgi:tetratricopeptide (TPR) repeat protein